MPSGGSGRWLAGEYSHPLYLQTLCPLAAIPPSLLVGAIVIPPSRNRYAFGAVKRRISFKHVVHTVRKLLRCELAQFTLPCEKRTIGTFDAGIG